MTKNILALFFFCFCSILNIVAQPPAKDKLILILEEEMQREKDGFAKTNQPPYYIDYRVNAVEVAAINSSFGSLTQSFTNKNRLLNVHVRVGDYKLDNTFPFESKEREFDFENMRNTTLPLEDNPDAVKYSLWQATNSEYKKALESYKRVKNFATEEALKKAPPSFSKETPNTFYEAPIKGLDETFLKKEWEEKTRKYSMLFLGKQDIVSGEVSLQVLNERTYFVSSEGSSVVQNFTYSYLNISASVRAEDGEIVPLHQSYFVPSLSEFPSDDVIIKDINDMLVTLGKLRTAPLADPYSGPALLAAPIAGVFFHEIFGHRVEGHRLNDDNDGQTFKSKLNQKVLLETIDVFFDPTMKQFEGNHLNGAYGYDDEGMKGQRVTVVEKGVLKTFLMSRTPLESVSNSNGHGRAAAGMSPVSRQSNLIVMATKMKQDNELRQMLIKECQKQKKEYGYLFKNVVGGFTLTGRYTPNAFNIFPTEVYRVYVNGKPDELVRGVDLIGTPLAMFAEIAAVGNKHEIFTGFCGAESGNVPVSAISPALFVRRIETQKKNKSKIETTLLPPPAAKN